MPIQKFQIQSFLVHSFVISSIEGIVFGPNGTLYVASFLNDQIVKYSKEGEFLGVVSRSLVCLSVKHKS